MSEVTRSSIASEFCRMARLATPNSAESLNAQLFFKTRLMGVTDERLLNPLPKMTDEQERAEFQAKCMDGVERVVRSLTGTEFQTAVSFETLMRMVPKEEAGISLVLHKVGLSAGITAPRGWAPKREMKP
jgi:hypothetical protein